MRREPKGGNKVSLLKGRLVLVELKAATIG